MMDYMRNIRGFNTHKQRSKTGMCLFTSIIEYIYIYIYMCVCVCVCVLVELYRNLKERRRKV